MNLKRKATGLIAMGLLVILNPFAVLAKDCTKEICNPVGLDDPDVATLVGRFITTVLPLTGAVALMMFLVGAIYWVISAGNPEQVKKGRDTAVWALVGSIVVIGSYVALSFIFKVFTSSTNLTTSP
ncbi:MAG: hypothetical protein AB1352_02790 [Patescibacteria group bacterium]